MRRSKVITLCTLTVFVFLLYWVSSAGLANISYLRAYHYLDRWHNEGKQSTPDEIQDALKYIQRANALHPNHPHYLNTYASVLLWESDSLTNAQEQKAGYQAVLDLYERSAKLRPLWPNTWSAMVMVKWRLNEFDEQMQHYVERADVLGPFSPKVHEDLVQIGFALRQRDPFTQYDFFKRHLLRGLKDGKSRGSILEQVKIHNASIITCRWLSQAEQLPPRGLLCPQ